MGKDKENGELKSFEISFGTVIESLESIDSPRHVVLDVGKGKWFVTAQIIEQEGYEALGIAGTAGVENIASITNEKWSVVRILNAMKNYFGGTVSDAMVQMIKKNSHQKSRVINP